MTTVVSHRTHAAYLLAPVNATLRSMCGTDDVPGLAPGLLVHDDAGWLPATELLDGSRLPDLLESAQRRWQASPHAAATLAWKSYSYWLALPAVLGWASARRVPLLHPADVLMRFEDQRRLLTFGLRPSVVVAVLPTEPPALCGLPQVRVVGDEAELLLALRQSLLDTHLKPLLDAIQAQVRVGARTLLGSVSSGIALGILRAAGVLSGSAVEHVDTLLETLGTGDLIELVHGPAGEPTVRRKTCCLAFTLPRPKICVGCCIRPGPAHPDSHTHAHRVRLKRMTEQITPQQFHEADGVEDWRVVGDGACTHFRTGSFGAGAKLVSAISALAGVEDHHPDVDLRQGGVTVRLITNTEDYDGLSEWDLALARQISVAARDLGVPADPSAVQTVQVTIDALVAAEVVPFWQAVLGYSDRGDPPEDLVDPHGRGASFWFQKMDAPRPQRNRIHVDVWVPHDQAEARIAAAIAAGGRLVSDERAPSWWTLADAEGNEVDVATWMGRD